MNDRLEKSPRIEVVDALRGFAVMSILLVHNLEHFIFPIYPLEPAAWLATLDKIVFDTTFFLFAGKAYAIFALLFGFTFYIQSYNQKIKGKDFGYRFLWRLLLLAGFATLNAAFFPAGDVLMLFVVVGVILFLTRHWSDGWVMALAVVCLMQPIELYHFIALKVNPQYMLPDLNVGAMYEEVAQVTKSGDFWDFILCNIGLGQKASFLWAVNAGRMMQTGGLFLLGFLLGRRHLFLGTPENIRFWKRILVIAAIAFIPLYILGIHYAGTEDAALSQVAVIFDMWHKLAFTFVLISGFVLIYYGTAFRNNAGLLRLYGKMSLTNYISQSIIGALIYFPIGLYLAPYCGYTVSLLIGIAVFILQLIFCRYWLSSHKQGPLEAIWHRLTWINS